MEQDSRVLKILSKAMASAVEKTTEKIGEELAKQWLPAVIAGAVSGPLAAGGAAAAGALIEALRKETSAVERKLDKVLSEPFTTAARTVRKVLSVEIRNDAEHAESQRQLQIAYDGLERALTFARDDSEDKVLLVRLYQTMVAALMDGGGAVLRLALSELRARAGATRELAAQELAGAERVRKREPGVVASVYENHQRLANIMPGPGMMRGEGFRPSILPESHLESILQGMESGYRERAALLEQRASDLENFCALMDAVHNCRGEIFRSAKLARR